MRIGLLSDDRRDGPLAKQRAGMGAVDRMWPPDDRAEVLGRDLALRHGDVLLVPHARVLGRTMRQRDLVMDDLAARGVWIEVPGRAPMLTDSAEAKAQIHADARRPTGTGTAKQKRRAGRPAKFAGIPDEDMAQIIAWWDGPEQTDAMLALASERLGKKVSRSTLYRIIGRGRAPNPERTRKPVRRRKNTKEPKA